jgi:hypothetical protein
MTQELLKHREILGEGLDFMYQGYEYTKLIFLKPIIKRLIKKDMEDLNLV